MQTETTKNPIIKLFSEPCFKSMLLGISASVFFWNFFDYGALALGFNATIFIICFYFLITNRKLNNLSEWQFLWQWETPVILLALSYSIYDNMFIKYCNFLALPLILGTVIQRRNSAVSIYFCATVRSLFSLLILSTIEPLLHLFASLSTHVNFFKKLKPNCLSIKSQNNLSIYKGLSVLFLLACFIIIPLLGSIEPKFSSVIEIFFSYIIDLLKYIFGEETFKKVLFACFTSVACLATYLAWNIKQTLDTTSERQYDSISAGIILVGISLIYAVFIFIQVDNLFVDALPQDFTSTESYVKSGFWQLIALSTLNITLLFFCYGNQNTLLRKILVLFLVASTLLLVSSAHRMYLYITFHGLSYEKFYASYAILFCILSLINMIWSVLRNHKTNVIQSTLLILIWMYSLVTVFPVEDLSVRFNRHLSELPNSKIKLYESYMFGIDALEYIHNNRDYLNKMYNDCTYGLYQSSLCLTDADLWLLKTHELLEKKRWYESNYTSIRASFIEVNI